MRRGVLLLSALLATGAASAQTSPMPSDDDPRIQTVEPLPGEPIRLVAFPDSPLVVIMRPGEQVERVTVSDGAAFDVRVIGRRDTLSIMPRRPGATASIAVTTDRDAYTFEAETGRDLVAAYLVRLVGSDEPLPANDAFPPPNLAQMTGSYRLSGNRELRPSEIADDGDKTYLRWDEHQALPAVFGIGPGGEEEVVNGYMRGDLFTIDRVYGALVFRIDKTRAEARRLQGLASR